MDVRDQNKVIKAGFTLLRADNHPSPRIKVKDGQSCEWRTMQVFPTKAARDREFNRLLTLDHFIHDIN